MNPDDDDDEDAKDDAAICLDEEDVFCASGGSPADKQFHSNWL